MPDSANRRLEIAAARAAFLSSGAEATNGVPDHIAASWRRSASAGVGNTALVPQYHDDLDVASRLVRCATPVITRLIDETADLALSVALTDNRARILSRTDTSRTIGLLLDNVSLNSGFGYAETDTGTNGIGTVLESGQAVHIRGPEHYADALQIFACAGAPIRDPITGRIEGVLDMSSLADHSSPLMHSLVRSAARHIERELLVDHSQCQQALFDTYLRTDARSRLAVMAVGDSMVTMNAQAQRLLDAADQMALQEHARFLMARHDEVDDQVEMPSGITVRMRGSRIMVGNDTAGMVLVIDDVSAPRAAKPRHPPSDGGVLPTPTGGPRSCIGNLGGRPAEASSPVDVNRTASWRAAAARIEAGLRERQPLLVMGEAGSGKFTLLTEVFHALQKGGRSISFDAADIAATAYDPAASLAESSVPTIYIFRNIDTLCTEGVERLSAFMLAALDTELPVSVAATVSESLDSGLPFNELLPYFQTSVIVPPVRHRTADLAAITTRVLRDMAPHREVRVSADAMRLIERYTWPRNICQLQEALASALKKRPVGVIEENDLPGYCHTTARRALSPLEQADRDAVIAALRDADGNRVHAARALGLARSSLYRRLKQYGITTV
ncbi:sigma-54-dependent Fis family transcriptional regulator [Mycolicibacterium komossense]|uniref:GAF domain-containing protein n=1 Tax=Mycolicibacterium komossense TaxID=1779 RepID=A0ABT3CFH7_9MYCO|nr:helix-turn-helix domain-containing protein [Mycolicibacterium komossense]MCV7228269.1 GAF domain-containing protein [Mycolicibacterium komossense]